MGTRLAWTLALVAGLAAGAPASAQDLKNSDDGYLAAKLLLGIGGEGELEIGGLPGEGSDDLELSYGLGVAYVKPLHDYFALGAQLSLLSWQTDASERADLDRNLLVDLSLVPQLKLAVLESLELYVAVPVGLTLDFIGEDDFAGLAEVGTGFGFNVAVLAGARVAITEGFGLVGELGYAYHAFTHATETALGDGPDLEISTGQLALNLGGYFTL